MNGKELKFVLDVLQDRESDANVDWYSVLGFLELNRVAGYFYTRAQKLGMKLPGGVAARLEAVYRSQAARNCRMGEGIAQIGEALEEKRIPYAFLKGSVLNNTDFGKPLGGTAKLAYLRGGGLFGMRFERKPAFYEGGERASNDVDLLILPKDVGKVQQCLRELGFVQGYYDRETREIVEFTREEIVKRRMNRGETAPFLRLANSPELAFLEADINFSLDYLPTTGGTLLTGMLDRAQHYDSATLGKVRGLMPEDFLLHLILHQYKEMTVYSMVRRGKDLELYKLLDLCLFLQAGLIDSRKFIGGVRAYGLEKPVAGVLWTVYQIFDGMPTELLQLLGVSQDSLREEVIDPENGGKRYRWRAEARQRLRCFDRKRFLCEVQNGESMG